MKTFVVILLLAVCSAVHGGVASTNLFAICLLDSPAAQPWPDLAATNLTNLRMVSPPVLTDSDFVAFDTTNQTFVLTSAAAKRLSLTIWSLAKKDAPGWGEDVPYVYHTGEFDLIPVPAPFVLKVRGEPIYAGAFFTPVSSSGFSGPVIIAEKMLIGTNVATSATFSFSIQLGYPGTFLRTPDPRHDTRIVSAVHTLFTKRK